MGFHTFTFVNEALLKLKQYLNVEDNFALTEIYFMQDGAELIVQTLTKFMAKACDIGDFGLVYSA